VGDATIQGLIGRCGTLGRVRDTYVNQARRGKGAQNYPEVRYGVELVEGERFPPESIVYENFTLSLAVLQESRSGPGPRAKGAKLVGEVFSEEFFRAFDRLYNLNKSEIKKNRAAMLVDLLAVDAAGRRVQLAEVKKYNRGAKRTEPVQKDRCWSWPSSATPSTSWVRRHSLVNRSQFGPTWWPLQRVKTFGFIGLSPRYTWSMLWCSAGCLCGGADPGEGGGRSSWASDEETHAKVLG
jgi:hypothetical protein